MDPITSGAAMPPSIQSIPKAAESESDLVVNKFGEMVTKSDASSEMREMMADDKKNQNTTVEDNGIGGTFEAEA